MATRQEWQRYMKGQPMSFKVEVQADSSGEWCGNELRFATPEQANEYAQDLFRRWTAVRQWRVVKCNEPATEAPQGAALEG